MGVQGVQWLAHTGPVNMTLPYTLAPLTQLSSLQIKGCNSFRMALSIMALTGAQTQKVRKLFYLTILTPCSGQALLYSDGAGGFLSGKLRISWFCDMEFISRLLSSRNWTITSTFC